LRRSNVWGRFRCFFHRMQQSNVSWRFGGWKETMIPPLSTYIGCLLGVLDRPSNWHRRQLTSCDSGVFVTMVSPEPGVLIILVGMVSIVKEERMWVDRMNKMIEKRVPWLLTFWDRSILKSMACLGGLGGSFVESIAALYNLMTMTLDLVGLDYRTSSRLKFELKVSSWRQNRKLLGDLG
jgi:hypothetical protein